MDIKELFEDHFDLLSELLNTIKVGICICDENGEIIFVNDANVRAGGLGKEDLMGKKMLALVKEGYVEDSATLKVLESHKEENVLMALGDGGYSFTTGVPITDNQEIKYIICTEFDKTEFIDLNKTLKEKEITLTKADKALDFSIKYNNITQDSIVYRSSQMEDVITKAIKVAHLDITILVTGESGTGKEIIATLINKNSPRADKPFIKVNCAAIPDNLIESELFGYEKGAFTGADSGGKAGLFELANHGTIFLDEIGELPIQLQSTLLRVLQEKEIMRIGSSTPKPIDVRVIAATNRNLKACIKEGTFREDLYYRLNILPIHIPPLRNRKSDIKVLAEHFVEKTNEKYELNKQLTSEAIYELEKHHWPGNVRELFNVLERTMVIFDGTSIKSFQIKRQLMNHDMIEQSIYTSKGKESYSLNDYLMQYEKEIILTLLDELGTPLEVAKALNVDKSTINRKIKKYREDSL